MKLVFYEYRYTNFIGKMIYERTTGFPMVPKGWNIELVYYTQSRKKQSFQSCLFFVTTSNHNLISFSDVPIFSITHIVPTHLKPNKTKNPSAIAALSLYTLIKRFATKPLASRLHFQPRHSLFSPVVSIAIFRIANTWVLLYRSIWANWTIWEAHAVCSRVHPFRCRHTCGSHVWGQM